MALRILILCLAFSATLVHAGEPVDLDMVMRIKQEGFEKSQLMNTIHYLTDVHGPRLTNSPNYEKAAQWAMDKMTEWGLENVRLESMGEFGAGWSSGRVSVHMVDPQVVPLLAYPRVWTPGTGGTVTGRVVRADLRTIVDFDDYRGTLNNAIVLLDAPEKMQPDFLPDARRFDEEQLADMSEAPIPGPRKPRSRRDRSFDQKLQAFMAEEGALATVVTGSGRKDDGTVMVSRGGTYETDKPRATVPGLAMATEHYGRICRLLDDSVDVRLELQVEAQFHDDQTEAYNILAEYPGTDKRDEVVMLGAHFDSWHAGTGATDVAGGCAVMMEAIRILKALDVQPRRTIRIGMWAAEEQGLLGSRAYVKKHFADPENMELKPGHSKLSAYFNLDNGSGKIRGVYLQQNDAIRPIFEQWLKPFHDLGAATVTLRNTGSTDHVAFDAVGLPGFQFIQDPLEYKRTHHSNMDLYERISENDLKQAAVIIASFVYHAAMRDELLPRKPLPAPLPSRKN